MASTSSSGEVKSAAPADFSAAAAAVTGRSTVALPAGATGQPLLHVVPRVPNPPQYNEEIRRALIGYDNMMQCAAVCLDVASASKTLVVGSGTGHELNAFASVPRTDARPWSVVGVDPSSMMVEMAAGYMKAKLTPEQLARVDNRHGFASHLPLDDDRYTGFDAASLVLVLHGLPDDDTPTGKRALLLSITARLRPGAKIFIVDHHGARTDAAFAQQVDRWIAFMVLSGVKLELGEMFRKGVMTVVPVMTPERTVELLASVGLHDVITMYQSFMTRGIVATYRPTADQLAETAAVAKATAADIAADRERAAAAATAAAPAAASS